MHHYVLVATIALFGFSLRAEVSQPQREQIDKLTGAKGTYTAPEDTYRVAFPRNDVKFTVEGRPMHPFMGFTSWAAFTAAPGHGLMVMGDLVLLEDEVNPVMSVALANGLDVTALHNHFFFESPRVMYMHIGGSGDASVLAGGVRKALDKVKEIRAGAASPSSRFAGPMTPEANSITAGSIDQVLGVKGQSQDGMYKMTIGRPAAMHGAKAGSAMGVNTWAAFAGADESALVDGDFAMVEGELQAVLKALRAGGIHLVAIHNHMTHEEPKYVFLHYWGKGRAVDLAKTLRSALDKQGR